MFSFNLNYFHKGLPRWRSGEESACQCRRRERCRFHPWVRKISWSRKLQPTPVFLPGKFRGQRSQVGNSPWGRKESDTTEWLTVPPQISCLHRQSQWRLGLPHRNSGRHSSLHNRREDIFVKSLLHACHCIKMFHRHCFIWVWRQPARQVI